MLSDASEIEKYIGLCKTKGEIHHRHSLNSRKWENILSFSSALVTASTSLTMPLLAINGESAINVAIAGNLFVFVGVIISALKTNYGFITLIYQHGHLSSEFSDLECDFRNFQRRHSVEAGHGHDDDLEKLILRYQAICSRSNIQGVKDCRWCCCYA